MPRTAFFKVTRNALERVTDPYNFACPLTAALWNFRWQVRGYLDEVPNATEAQLRARFMHPSGSGKNFQNLKSLAATTWDRQQQQLATMVLVDLVAVYEAWSKAILKAATGSDAFAEKHEKGLQFPTVGSKGVRPTINAATASQSSLIRAAFQGALAANRRYTSSHLENLLQCFRYFKEVRNAIAHGGGIASDRTVGAAADYGSALASGGLGMPYPPPHHAYKVGDEVTLDLRSVVGFGEALLRMMITIDADLSVSVDAEEELIAVWRQRARGRETLSADLERRNAHIALAFSSSGMPRPTATEALAAFLKAHRLVTY